MNTLNTNKIVHNIKRDIKHLLGKRKGGLKIKLLKHEAVVHPKFCGRFERWLCYGV
jgi:hypothetical protein